MGKICYWKTTETHFIKKVMILVIAPAGSFNFNLFENEEYKKVCDFVNSMFNFVMATVINKATGTQYTQAHF